MQSLWVYHAMSILLRHIYAQIHCNSIVFIEACQLNVSELTVILSDIKFASFTACKTLVSKDMMCLVNEVNLKNQKSGVLRHFRVATFCCFYQS